MKDGGAEGIAIGPLAILANAAALLLELELEPRASPCEDDAPEVDGADMLVEAEAAASCCCCWGVTGGENPPTLSMDAFLLLLDCLDSIPMGDEPDDCDSSV
jgi:hypothetical protein